MVSSSIEAFFSNAYKATISAFAAGKEESASSDEDGTRTKESASTAGSSQELLGEQYEGVKDDLIALVRDENPRVALDRLWEEAEEDPALLNSCHPLTHEIGRAAYEKYKDFGEAMEYQDEACEAGYFHGVIESRLSKSTDVFADMKTMCDPYPQESYVSWQCYHGLGHGVMFYTANDLPRSLEMCDAFEGAAFKRSQCADGVFMENFNTDQKLHTSAYLKEDDPFYPCAEQAEHYKASCYLYSAYYWLSLNEDDYIGALGWCEGAEADFRSSCVQGVGAQMMRRHMSDPAFVESTCAEGKPGQIAPCIEGMVGMYISHNNSVESTRALCEQLQSSDQPPCYATVESLSGLYET